MTNDLKQQFESISNEYFAALRLESEIREIAFLPVDLKLLDVPVKQLTPLHVSYLDWMENAYITKGKNPEIKDTLQFLWVVSTEFKLGDDEARSKFYNSHTNVNHEEMSNEIREYIGSSYLDDEPIINRSASTKKKSSDESYYAWIASYVHLLATEYGWTDDYIMNLPIARILQYQRCIIESKMGDDAIMRNKLSTKYIAEVRRLHEEIQKESRV